jgi:hypothetical protein
MTKFWLVNHSWESFKRTKEYCGFTSESVRNRISIEDKIVYFGQGIVFGLFEVISLPNNEFKGWKKDYPYQVKLKPIILSQRGLYAKPLESKILMHKAEERNSDLVELTKDEFIQIKKAIETNQKELSFA